MGVVLAGGLARRMGGGDKPLLPIAGRSMLDHVIERLAPQVDALVLNANGAPERFADYGLPVVADTVAGHPGPLAGVLAGLAWARDNRPTTRWVVSAAGDTPFLPRDLVSQFAAALADAAPGTIAVAAHAGATHQAVAAYPVELADGLDRDLRAGEARALLAWIARHRHVFVPFEAAEGVDPFFNVNTPEDLAAAERAIGTLGKADPGRTGAA